MTSVERQEPRKTRIISAVRPAGDGAFAQHAVDRVGDEHPSSLILSPAGAEARMVCRAFCFDVVDDRQRGGIAVLDHAKQDRAVTILTARRSAAPSIRPALGHVLQEDSGAVGELDRHHVEIVDRRRRRVGSHRILALLILAVPDGKVRFWVLTALTMSRGVSPRDRSFSGRYPP